MTVRTYDCKVIDFSWFWPSFGCFVPHSAGASGAGDMVGVGFLPWVKDIPTVCQTQHN